MPPDNATGLPNEIELEDNPIDMDDDPMKLAIKPWALFIVTEIGFDEPAGIPSRVQPVKLKSVAAVAETETGLVESYQYDPAAGFVLPPFEG